MQFPLRPFYSYDEIVNAKVDSEQKKNETEIFPFEKIKSSKLDKILLYILKVFLVQSARKTYFFT